MNKAISFTIVTALVLLVNYSFALECPKFPEQTNKDWDVNVSAEVARIGPLKGADLKTATRNITQDLLGKLPDAGRIYLEQMMFAAYCSTLRDDKTLTETERSNRLKEYIQEVRNVIRNKNDTGNRKESPISKKNITEDRKTLPTSPSKKKNTAVIALKPKPRVLTPDQKKAILDYLSSRPTGTLVIKASITLSDSWSYANQIAESFRDSGWNVRLDNSTICSSNLPDLWITVKDVYHVPESFFMLADALRAAGLTHIANSDPSLSDKEEVWLSVCTK